MPPDPKLPAEWGKIDGEDHPDTTIANAATAIERERCAKIAEGAYTEKDRMEFRGCGNMIARLIRGHG